VAKSAGVVHFGHGVFLVGWAVGADRLEGEVHAQGKGSQCELGVGKS